MEANATTLVKATRGRIRSLFRGSDLSVRSRLIACFVLIVLLMIAADAVAVWQFRQMAAPAQRVSTAEQISLAVVRVHLDVDTFRDSVVALAGSHDARQFSGEATSIRQTFLEHVDHAEQLLRANPDIEEDPPISSALESLRVTLLSQLDTAVQLATADEWNAVQSRMANQIPALIEYSSLLVERVDQQALQQRIKASEDAQKARQRLFIIVPIAALLTLLAAAALGWYVTRTVTAPLFELTASAEALARGDFQRKVHLRGNNELAVLGNAFNYAAQQLQKREEERERLRQVQSELAHIQRVTTMGEFAASIAHEIRQPISAVSTNAKTCLLWLGREQPNIKEAREAASRIIQNVTRASDIITRIRILFKKGEEQRESVDVNEVIEEIVSLLRSEAGRNAISIRTELAPKLPHVMADRVQLQQVFMNLMRNGIDAINEVAMAGDEANKAGDLTIKSQRNAVDHLLISISDTGIGLPPEQANKVFEAFFTTKPQGTGMGLSISRSIIESHGGHLWATGNPDHRGTTFQFTLPIDHAATAVA